MDPENQKSGFRLEISGNGMDGQAYLKLPTYPLTGHMKVSKSVRLYDLLGKYEGPDIIFDFNEEGLLAGIEILA